MKEYIKYYYDLNIDNIEKVDNKYYFSFNGVKFVLFSFSKETSDNYIIDKCFMSQYYLIVYNKNQKILSELPNEKIVLFNLKTKENRSINWKDINKSTKYQINHKINWEELWKSKIDYIESYVYKTNNNPLINEMINYYIGMSENALQYLKTTLLEEKDIHKWNNISHVRINSHMTLYDYFNPFNMIYDHPTRDIAEYSKSLIESNEFSIYELIKKINEYNFSKGEIRILISRIIFPTHFYDTYEQFLNGKLDAIKLKKTLNSIESYEQKIKSCINFLVKFFDVPNINWLINSNDF